MVTDPVQTRWCVMLGLLLGGSVIGGGGQLAWAQGAGQGDVQARVEVHGQLSVQAPTEASPQLSVDQQLQALASPDPSVRIGAVRALGDAGEVRAVPALRATLAGDSSPEVRGWAVRALFQIGTPEAQGALAQAAQSDPDERVRGLASQHLAANASVGSGPVLVPAPAPGTPGPAMPQIVVVQAPPPTAAVPVAAPPPPVVAPRRPSRPGLGLRIAGWTLWGVGYLVALSTGSALVAEGDVDHGWEFFIPLVGPAVYGTQLWAREEDPVVEVLFGFLGLLCWLDAALQITGAALLITGHVRGARSQVARSSRRQLAVLPGGPGGHPGLTLGGFF